MVNALVESLDGEIDYDSSEALTTFTIVLAMKNKESLESSISQGGNEFMFDDFDDMKEF